MLTRVMHGYILNDAAGAFRAERSEVEERACRSAQDAYIR